MATYKVLQDIEAEDKLLGPLTLRQFIYAGVAAICGYLTFLVVSKGVGVLAVVFFPATIMAGFFAWPWSRDQPTEVWALAKIRFLVKSRKRIWNQSGVKELVTITAPKKIEHNYTNGLSETEVRSRLKILASTIDSRGWAIKNASVNMFPQPSMMNNSDSDRLISLSSLPQDVPAIDVLPSDDMLDEENNPRAASVESKLEASSKAHRQRLINTLQEDLPKQPMPPPAPTPRQDYWFLNQPTQAAASVPQNAVTFNTQVVAPGASAADLPITAADPTADEESLIRQLKEQDHSVPSPVSHLHTILPLSAQQQAAKNAQAQAAAQAAQTQDSAMTQANQPVILDLASNDDLNVATIAREAHKRRELPTDEVVISLH